MTSTFLNKLGIIKLKPPRNPDYVTYESRLKSFKIWPPGLKQTDVEMSEAGFFYNHCVSDIVKCFYCGLALDKWMPNDVPIFEHARWSPECGYVLLMKGKSYVKSVLSTITPEMQAQIKKKKKEEEEEEDREMLRIMKFMDLGVFPPPPTLQDQKKVLAVKEEELEEITSLSTLKSEIERLKFARQCRVCMNEQIDSYYHVRTWYRARSVLLLYPSVRCVGRRSLQQ